MNAKTEEDPEVEITTEEEDTRTYILLFILV
jgi:hypothetical protein